METAQTSIEKRIVPRRGWGYFWLLVAGVTCLMVFLVAYLWNAAGNNPKYSFSWELRISNLLIYLCAWGILLPMVLWFTRRYPLSWDVVIPNVFLHIIAALLFTLTHRVLYLAGIWIGSNSLNLPSVGSIEWTVRSRLVNQLPLGIFVYFVMLISIRAIASARRLQQAEVRAARLAAQLSKAQLQALKMQLHPHFLFNTLNSISTLIHENADAADEMIGRLGDFLRLTLDNLGTQIVTLQRELEFLTLYLSIEEIRFQDRLTVHFEIDQDTTLLRVPNLIFQPLVENAIKHGIAPEAKKGTITIRSSSKDGRLRLEVEDNGPGVRPDRVNNQGLGLKNIKERLDELYGRDYRLELKNHPNGGCTTLLDIPAQPNNMGQQLTVRS